MKTFIKEFLSQIRGEQSIKKLVNRGLKVGANFKMMSGCIIDPSHCWHIEIGDNVILAPRVHILAHDASTKLFLDYTKVANVKIGNNVFVGANSIILPGVSIGDNVVIGAGSIVSRDIPSNSLALGSPANVVSSLQEYIDKEKQKMNPQNCFEEEFTLRNPDFGKQHSDKLNEVCRKYKTVYVK